jgi:hypothetical protein
MPTDLVGIFDLFAFTYKVIKHTQKEKIRGNLIPRRERIILCELPKGY